VIAETRTTAKHAALQAKVTAFIFPPPPSLFIILAIVLSLWSFCYASVAIVSSLASSCSYTHTPES
jgi:hypothetical protein